MHFTGQEIHLGGSEYDSIKRAKKYLGEASI
jgi:hypothetical protein